MLTVTDGIIIREQNIGEADRIVTVLTRELGVVRAFASGARRIKSKNLSSTGLLCYSRITLFRSKDTYRINDAEPLELFFDLRRDIEKISLAQYFCELALTLAPAEEEAGDFLRLILNALFLLEKGLRPPALIKAAAELSALTLAGYMPDLTDCPRCGREDAFRFHLRQGRLFCGACLAPGPDTVDLSAGVLAAMRFIVYSETGKVFSFSLPEESLKKLAAVSEAYLLAQTDRRFAALEFYKTLLP